MTTIRYYSGSFSYNINLKYYLFTCDIGLEKNSTIFLFLAAINIFLYLASKVAPMKRAKERSLIDCDTIPGDFADLLLSTGDFYIISGARLSELND